MTDKDSTEQKLELHNLVALAKSARDKKLAGKPLTKKEIAAVAALKARQGEAPPEQTPQAPAIDAKAIVRMIVALEPGALPEQAIRDVLGTAAARSLTEVTAAFNVSNATVKHTWRPNGMPGDGKKRIFPWADIVIWYLQRIQRNDVARGTTEFTKRKQEAELRIVEADARIKVRKDQRDEGAFVQVAPVRAEVASYISVCRDDLMSIPDDVKPMFPADQADKLKDELERRIHKALTALATRPLDQFLRRISSDDEL